ncbi:MAG: hypothetical protein AAF226_14300 [Verrucomicrobiota bacterium]
MRLCSRHLSPLFWLPATLALGDVTVTLAGQPATYWAGDYSTAIDLNPAVRLALRTTPWLAIPGTVIWLAGIAWGTSRPPHPWNIRFYQILCIAHGVCIAGWAVRWDASNWIVITQLTVIVGNLIWLQTKQNLNHIAPE